MAPYYGRSTAIGSSRLNMSSSLPALYNFHNSSSFHTISTFTNDPSIDPNTAYKLQIGCLIMMQDINEKDTRLLKNWNKISSVIAVKLENVNEIHIFGHLVLEWLMNYPKELFNCRILSALCKLLTFEETKIGSHGIVLSCFEAVRYYLGNLVKNQEQFK